MNSDQIQQAVRLANGIQTLSAKELSMFVGKTILSSIDRYEAKSAIESVAKEEFHKEFGTLVKSWVDVAEDMAKETEACFACEVLTSLHLER